MEGVPNDIVVSEIVYGYLRLALNIPRYRLQKYVVRHTDKISEMLEQDVYPLFTDFEHLPTSVDINVLCSCIEL